MPSEAEWTQLLHRRGQLLSNANHLSSMLGKRNLCTPRFRPITLRCCYVLLRRHVDSQTIILLGQFAPRRDIL